jgi:4-amino-4-deoxy-L-arabinose transferase-like glycosyltransferase
MLKTPLKKVEKSCRMPFLFFILNFSVYVLLGLFLYPIWIKRELIYFDISLGVLSFFMWIFTAFTAPGFITKPKNVEFLKLM